MYEIVEKWREYAIWDYTDVHRPILKGFRKDTPEEVIKDFKESQIFHSIDEDEMYVYGIYDKDFKLIGFRKDTPKEFLDRYKAYIKAFPDE